MNHQELTQFVREAAAELGLHVDAMFLIGSRAHAVSLSKSDYDVKVITHGTPEAYISIRKHNLQKQITKISPDGLPVNISFMDITYAAQRMCDGTAQHIFSWLQSQVVLFCTDDFVSLVNLATKFYLSTPEITAVMLQRMTQYYWIVGDKEMQQGLDPTRYMDKSRQRLLAALGDACYYHLSARAESFTQKFPHDLMQAMRAVHALEPEIMTEAAMRRIKVAVEKWSSNNPDNGFLIAGIGKVAIKLLYTKFKRVPNVKITGDENAFNTKVRSIVLSTK